VAKTHPHARTLLYYVNDSITKLRESGEYDKITESHLSRFWEAQDMENKLVSGNTPDSSASKPQAPAAASATSAVERGKQNGASGEAGKTKKEK